MQFSIDQQEDRFVLVRFTGLWAIPRSSPAAPVILAACRERHQDRALIDFTGVENRRVSLIERFRLGISALSLVELRKVAVAGRPDLLDRQRFGEMVARNRGINIRAFTTLHEATQWLLGEDP